MSIVTPARPGVGSPFPSEVQPDSLTSRAKCKRRAPGFRIMDYEDGDSRELNQHRFSLPSSGPTGLRRSPVQEVRPSKDNPTLVPWLQLLAFPRFHEANLT